MHARQLEFDLEPTRPTTRRLGDALRRGCWRVVIWSPVWAALILFAQVALLGLRPALAERDRLARERERLVERTDLRRGEHEHLLARARALEDPMYRERVRRARRDGSSDDEALSLPLSR
ncbi:MAG: hypothetical protein O7B99_15990 [Planctomycetota bacterium]|nr:hypothetical protein [Planctomycetota bacterium]